MYAGKMHKYRFLTQSTKRMKAINSKERKNLYIRQYNLEQHFSDKILNSIRIVDLSCNEYLIRQESTLTHLYCLVDGKLQVELFQFDGSRTVFSFESAFSIIGDLELFFPKKSKIFSNVMAASSSSVLTIPLQVIHDYGMCDPLFLRFICEHLSKKLYKTCLLQSNASFPADFRLKKYLLSREEKEGTIIILENRDSIASMLGVSVRQLNRTLRQLAELGIISYKNKTVRILDIELLTQAYPPQQKLET
jgi:CRP/FNR family transcriptional regulator, putaive post-exponential-phase nitrogen-starvation regulator